MRKLLSLSAVLLLQACGSSSDNSDDNPRNSVASSIQSSIVISSSLPASLSSRSSSSRTSVANGLIIVTPVVSGNGQIQPAEPQVIATGNQLSFTITPDNGFYIANASGCGGSLQNQTFTTAILVNDCQIAVQFNQTGFVFIPDTVLKNAIRSELNIANNSEITSDQMQNLQQLEINSVPQTLTGLETATNLESLSIVNQTSSLPELDISALASLGDIEYLSLFNLRIINSSTIQNLTNLVSLNLSGSRLDNIQATVNSSKIINLNIADTNISNINFLSNKSALDYLNITNTSVYDLTPLLTSGLGSGDLVSMNYTCVYTGKYSNNTNIINQLRNRNVSIFNSFQNIGLYGDNQVCSNQLNELTANINAVYSTDLQINWQLTNTTQDLVCEIYIDLQGQQPRTPLSLVDNCGSITSTSFITAFSNAPVSLKVWDHFGSSKLFSASVTTESHATPYLYSYDWGQTIVKNDSRLIPNKAALLRLHILGNQSIPVPDIQIQALLNNTTTPLTSIKPSQLPVNKSFNNLHQNYRVTIDKSLMQPGLVINVTVEGIAKTITPNFGVDNKLNITLVPIQIENTLGIIPSQNAIRDAFLETWPFSEINLRNRLPYTSTATTAEDMENVLYEIQELQIMDGDNSHYYGVFSSNIYDLFDFNGFGGIAFIGDTTAIGSDSDPDLSIMLHEMGHSFSLQHVNCGEPDTYDPLYPYNTNSIGSLGITNNLSLLIQPNNYRDMMSYCQPEFVSDYSYEKAQDYLEQHPSQEFNLTSMRLQKTESPVQKNLFISGVIHPQSAELRRLIPLARTSTANQSGQYELRIYDNQQIQHHYFDTKEIDHIQNSGKFFSLIIPYTEITSLEIWKEEQLLYRENKTAPTGISSVQYRKTNTTPVITQTASNVCLDWDNKKYNSATLILNHDEGQSTIFMDTGNPHHCIDFDNIPGANQWHIVLRKGLQLDEFWQIY